MTETTPDEEPQAERGAPGSRDTGAAGPAAGPADRPAGTAGDEHPDDERTGVDS